MPTAAIIGAGVAGLSTAIALRKAGLDVEVYEESDLSIPLGAALTLWPNATAGLQRLGALDSVAAKSRTICSIEAVTRSGRSIVQSQPFEGLACILTRADLQNALVEIVGKRSIHLNRKVIDITEEETHAVVRFSDGSASNADVAIDASGIWSETATALLGNAPAFRGYGGVLAISRSFQGASLNAEGREYLGKGERFGIFELPEARRYWFYMQDQSIGQAAPTLENLIARAGEWHPVVLETVRQTDRQSLVPVSIFARTPPQRLGRKRVVCIGDAAHAMEPNMGQGACQAIEDAVALGVIARRAGIEDWASELGNARLSRVHSIMRSASFWRLVTHGSPVLQQLLRRALMILPSWLQSNSGRSMHRMPDYK